MTLSQNKLALLVAGIVALSASVGNARADDCDSQQFAPFGFLNKFKPNKTTKGLCGPIMRTNLPESCCHCPALRRRGVRRLGEVPGEDGVSSDYRV